MPQLNCTLSPGLWALLQERSRRTRQPVALIVGKALADYFEVAHHTLYQVSTATALVEGIYQGAVRVGNLREHGDLGLGTFEDLDGEMLIVDGHFFQVRCDGSVREVDDSVLNHLHFVSADRTRGVIYCNAVERICVFRSSARASTTSRCPKPRISSKPTCAEIRRRLSHRQKERKNEYHRCKAGSTNRRGITREESGGPGSRIYFRRTWSQDR